MYFIINTRLGLIAAMHGKKAWKHAEDYKIN